MELWKTRRREIMAGAVCLLLLIAVFLFLHRGEQRREASDIAVMRIAEVLAAHPSYARLMELRAEEQSLALEVQNIPDVFAITPPEADDAPFQDSVWQKNEELMEPIENSIQDAVKKVAEKKGLSVVIEKGAVVYGGQDVTQDVIKELGNSK